MRIANKKALSLRGMLYAQAAVLITLAAMPCLSTAYAADAAPLSLPSMGTPAAPAPSAAPIPAVVSPAPIAVSAPSPTTPSSASGTPAATDATQVAAIPGMPVPVPAAPGAEMKKNLSTQEDKITDGAKNVIKRIDSSSDQMTLEDLNAARQTVARIEAMIDVEKHMAELEKLRNERNGGGKAGATGFASAIPASALNPLPMPSAAPARPSAPQEREPIRQVEREKPKALLSEAEISRISGAEGKYSAVLKLGNGDTKTVKAGDKVSEHAFVRWISSSSVVVEENGETHTLHIKNIDAIYSAMR